MSVKIILHACYRRLCVEKQPREELKIIVASVGYLSSSQGAIHRYIRDSDALSDENTAVLCKNSLRAIHKGRYNGRKILF